MTHEEENNNNLRIKYKKKLWVVMDSLHTKSLNANDGYCLH